MKDCPGVNPCYWWIGKVTSSKNWEQPITGTLHKKTDIKGQTFAYRVRIIGRHDADVADENLPLAPVVLPTTAGNGLGGAMQPPIIKQNSYVVGFFADGEVGNEPMISGVLPINPQQVIDNTNGGYAAGTQVSNAAINPINNAPLEALSRNFSYASQRDQILDGRRSFYIPKTRACEGPAGPLKGIQKKIGDLIQLSNLLTSGAAGTLSDLKGLITNQINSVKTQILSLVKTLFTFVRTYIVGQISKQFTSLISGLTAQLSAKLGKQFQTAADIIGCLFNKIIKNLGNTLKSALDDITNKFITAPICAAEEFFSSLISGLFNELTSGIDSALSGILAGASSVLNNVFSVFNIVSNILKFLSCEEELDCEMPEQWSILSGVVQFLDDKTSFITSGISGITSSFESATAGITSSLEEVTCSTSQIPCGPPSINFIGSSGSGILANPVISTAGSIIGIDILSGGSGYVSPPTIQITDNCGNGSGAAAIVIMTKKADGSDSDSVGNVVMLDTGAGYLKAPDGSTGGNGNVYSKENATISLRKEYAVYKCGTIIKVRKDDLIYLKEDYVAVIYNKTGKVLQTLVGTGPDPIKVEYTGTLRTPDCTGNEDANSTTILTEKYSVHECGSMFNISKGDSIFLKENAVATLSNLEGDVLQTIIGKGVMTPILINFNGVITTPACEEETVEEKLPVTSDNYPVIPVIDDVALLDRGSNYSPDDKINITPSNGAELAVTFDVNGSVKDISVINGGSGFTEMPKITIESKTGINAVILPVLKFNKVSDGALPSGVDYINVVDCVGVVDK